MAAGESGAPGNVGMGSDTAKGRPKIREGSAAKLPLAFEKGQRAGVAAGMRAVPEDASCRRRRGSTAGSQRAGVAGTEQVALTV